MVILKPFRIYGSKLALLHNGVPSYISEESEYRKSVTQASMIGIGGR